MTIVNVSRRDFLKTGAGLGAGLVLGVSLPARFARAADPGKTFVPNAFVRIAPDGTITILAKHSEMGQGVHTSLAMVVADELEADWKDLRVEDAPAGDAYKNLAFGMQGTGGSTSSYESFEQMRKVGAAAREMLVAAAAKQWGVAPDTCRAVNGSVKHANGKSLSYGALVAGAAGMAAPQEPKLKDRKDWKFIGKPVKRVDSAAKSNGTAKFGIDADVPGMLVAVVARAPVYGGKVKRYDATKAKAVPGVKAVVEVPTGIAVAATGYWPAKKGRDALEIEWDDGPNAGFSSDSQGKLFAELLDKPGVSARKDGDAPAALKGAAKVIEATNEFPYLAHAPMEPLNCTVWIKPDGVEVWSPTQFQTIDQLTAASVAGVKPEQVKIHTLLLGGGFGRKAVPTADFTFEATHVAKALGAPVKVIWSREDDMRGYYYRTRVLVRSRVGLDARGMPVAWESDIVNCSIGRDTGFEKFLVKDGVDVTSVEGLSDLSYAVPNLRIDFHEAPKTVPVLWWRSVGHSFNAFVKETLIDECATAAGKDPVAYRLALLEQHPRQQALLKLVAEKAGWGKAPAEHFQGVAVHESFESIVAQVMEISMGTDGTPKIHRVVVAVDPGMVINPDTVHAQLQSAVAYGLSQALYGRITFKDGRVEQSNFHDYPVLRMADAPRIDSFILESGAKMGGMGEPGVPPTAPALANAIAAATGKRVHSLPIDTSMLKA